MPKGEHLSEFEFVVMAAILHLGRNAYGMRIRSFVEERSGRTILIGSVYTTLDRLKTKAYVRSTLGPSTPERGGRAKEYFELDAAGHAAFNRTQRMMASMLAGLEPGVA